MYMWNSAYTAVIITVIMLFNSAMFAYALANIRFRGKTILLSLIMVTYIMPATTTYVPSYVILSKMGLMNTHLGYMISSCASIFNIFFLRTTFSQIAPGIVEAARIDGATTWQTIWRVYMPCAKPAYLSFAVISVSYHWNNYLWPLIVTNSPANRTLTVGLAIFAKSKEANMQWANVCAAAFIIIIPLLLAFFVAQKQFMSSFVSAGIKE